MTLDRYLENRRWWEIGMVLSFTLVGLLANVGIEVLELARGGGEIGWHEPVILEGTSHAAIVLLFPLILWFDHRNTIRGHNWRRTVLAHALFSVAFSLAHLTLMYWARVGLFAATPGLGSYRWDSWPAQFAYEYLKRLSCIHVDHRHRLSLSIHTAATTGRGWIPGRRAR